MLSSFVEHVLIAKGPLGSFFFCYFFVYFADFAELSTTKSRINLQILSQGLPVSWSRFSSENLYAMW